jgi:hypothetical protein
MDLTKINLIEVPSPDIEERIVKMGESLTKAAERP